MITTLDVRAYRDLYGRADAAPEGHAAREIAETVNAAAKAAMDAIKAAGFMVDGSDDAEAMVGALTWYFLASNPSFRAAIPAEA